MLFDDNFLTSLPSNPRDALEIVVEHLTAFHRTLPGGQEYKRADDYREAYAVLEALVEAAGVDYDLPEYHPNIGLDDPMELVNFVVVNFDGVARVLAAESAEKKFSRTRERVRLALGRGFAYEFTTGDLARMQTLLNELREEIASCAALTDDHRRRLLERLERLQFELHRRVGNLDRFWGILIEAGVALGRFGQAVKPLTDRIREIMEIVWRTQGRSLGLPSSGPSLVLPEPPPEGKEGGCEGMHDPKSG